MIHYLYKTIKPVLFVTKVALDLDAKKMIHIIASNVVRIIQNMTQNLIIKFINFINKSKNAYKIAFLGLICIYNTSNKHVYSVILNTITFLRIK
jgi:hypothetical protein